MENKIELTKEAEIRREKMAIKNAYKAIIRIFQPTPDFKSEDLC